MVLRDLRWLLLLASGGAKTARPSVNYNTPCRKGVSKGVRCRWVEAGTCQQTHAVERPHLAPLAAGYAVGILSKDLWSVGLSSPLSKSAPLTETLTQRHCGLEAVTQSCPRHDAEARLKFRIWQTKVICPMRDILGRPRTQVSHPVICHPPCGDAHTKPTASALSGQWDYQTQA